jgi:hypothetical protein
MLIFHSMNIAEPQDLPTPLRFTQRLVRLVYGAVFLKESVFLFVSFTRCIYACTHTREKRAT